MGWKASLIVVGKKYQKEVTQLTSDLQLGTSIVEKEATLNEVLSPRQLCVGFYNGCTLIAHEAILMDFFNATPSNMEREFMNVFPSEELVVAAVNENSGLAGFSYLKNGQRIRTMLAVEGESVLTVGDPLEEEDNKDIYELPFSMPRRLLGKELDDDEVLATHMSVLQLS